MQRIPIPRYPEDIKPDWLSLVLRRNGVLPVGVNVRDLSLSDPGRDASYAGFVSRLTIEYDRPDVNAPRSIIAKLPASERLIRSLFRSLYRNEALFYRRLADQVPTKVPACYAALLNRRGTRSLLLLEDLIGLAEMKNHVEGCSIEQAKIALTSIARLHAKWWNAPTLDQIGWLGRYRVDSTQNWMIYAAAWAPFQYRMRHITPPGMMELCRSLWRYRDRLQQLAYARPVTLQHGDFRLANLAFTHDDVYVFDWQVVRSGPPLFDVAYFMFTSLLVGQRRVAEQELLAAYRDVLVRSGIEYSMDELWHDYRLGLLLTVPQSMVIGAFLRLDEEREVELEVMLQRFDALRKDHELESMLRAYSGEWAYD